ncbi:MAG TPA: histidine kinase [Erysipelotrichaceae bacterium]|nr:histidine kinase [Erysipelotrichaceae bacterium]
MFNEIFGNIINNIAILMVIAYILPRLKFFRKTVFEHEKTLKEKIILGLIFGSIGILATHTGIRIQGAIANTRVIGVIAGGFLGGPMVGFIAGALAGSHRYLIDINGFTGLACAISTLAEGILGGMMYKRLRAGKHRYPTIFLTTVVAEMLQMIIILIVAKPYADALALVEIIAVPMIVMNSIGVVVFIEGLYTVQKNLDQTSAYHLKRAFDLAEMCLPYLRKGLDDEKSVQKTVRLILANSDVNAVFISNTERVIADAGEHLDKMKGFKALFDKSLKHCIATKDILILHEKELRPYRMESHFKRIMIAPLVKNGVTMGTIGLLDRKFKEKLETDIEFIQGLASLFSTQLALAEIDYQRKLLEQAELKALQYQINPHFLFNALNTISAYCRENPERARSLLLAMSSYFRNTLSTHKDKVDIHEEIEHVLSYLEIEKARFEDRLGVVIDVSPNLHFQVPNFIIQPLVENAIKHGMKNRLNIAIRVVELKKTYQVIVEDDGNGIDAEIIAKLYENRHDQDKIGLANTHHRLQRLYPNNKGLLIESVPFEHTRILMEIPK